MITVDRELARKHVNEILDDCDPPWNSHVTEDELDVFIELIVDCAIERVEEYFFDWLDDERGA